MTSSGGMHPADIQLKSQIVEALRDIGLELHKINEQLAAIAQFGLDVTVEQRKVGGSRTPFTVDVLQ